MGYTAMRGGIEAIEHAEALVAEPPAGASPDISAAQVRDHLRFAVERALSEGGLYDLDLAALAVRQAEGDSTEAALLLRAYRSTLPRLAYSEPAEGEELDVVRRITPALKSAPGGQVLGRTRDYSQRLLDFSLRRPRPPATPAMTPASAPEPPRFAKLVDLLRADGLLEEPDEDQADEQPYDITRDPLRFPAPRSARLQALARGDTDAMTALGYSTVRGLGGTHSTIAELRAGFLPVRIRHPYTDEPVCIGEVEVTEVEDMTVSRHSRPGSEEPTRLGLGYGMVFGRNERKAIAMALLERAIAGSGSAPANDEQFVLYHIDGIEASGFVEHLKLPHYVDFQAMSQRLRVLQARAAELGRTALAAVVATATNGVHGDGTLPALLAVPEMAHDHDGLAGDDEHAQLHALGVEHDH